MLLGEFLFLLYCVWKKQLILFSNKIHFTITQFVKILKNVFVWNRVCLTVRYKSVKTLFVGMYSIKKCMRFIISTCLYHHHAISHFPRKLTNYVKQCDDTTLDYVKLCEATRWETRKYVRTAGSRQWSLALRPVA